MANAQDEYTVRQSDRATSPRKYICSGTWPGSVRAAQTARTNRVHARHGLHLIETHALASMRQVKNAAVRYANGPFRAAAGYEQAANAAGTSILKIFNAGGSVGVGAARFYLAYHTEHQTDNSVKRDVYEASGSYSFSSADQLSLMYGYAHDQTGKGNNAQQVDLTYSYSLSKLTTLYGSTGFIQNRNRAQFTLNGTGYTGIAVAPGADTRGIIVGMLHRF